MVKIYKESLHDGLHFVMARHFAFLSENAEEWDYAETMDNGPVGNHSIRGLRKKVPSASKPGLSHTIFGTLFQKRRELGMK